MSTICIAKFLNTFLTQYKVIGSHSITVMFPLSQYSGTEVIIGGPSPCALQVGMRVTEKGH